MEKSPVALLPWSQGQLQPAGKKGPLCRLHHHIRNRTKEVSLERVPSEYPLLFNGYITGHYKKMREDSYLKGSLTSLVEAPHGLVYKVPNCICPEYEA